ncbi:MAG: Zn-ribbon domain-containing OB-fold protein [Chloroflexi bacterium]|nr:Zn-ribbon domain-containing OB-fold protein [Chloroflexota bacterium]
MAKQQVPIIEGLFTWPSQKPQLLASKCKKCGSYFFPKVAYCGNPDCPKDKANMEVVPLSNTGKMYTFTIHTAQPAHPFRMEPFKPYGVAMVDVPEGMRVLGMTTTTEGLKIGQAVEMTVGKLYEDAENEYITWMWKPVEK